MTQIPSTIPPDAVREFARRMGLPPLDERLQEAIAESVGPDVMARFLKSVRSALTEEGRRKADEYLLQGDAEGLLQHLEKRVPDFYRRLERFFPAR